MTLAHYIDTLERQGRCSFTLKELQNALKQPTKAIYSAVLHLVRREEIVSPARGFYVIVPAEYRVLGCLPAEYFIPYLMEYHQVPYYAALLTAARYHGASHQSSQVFQVMSTKRLRDIQCGKISVRFIQNKQLANNATQKIETSKSMLIISTPEITAMDLLKYPAQSGGLNHIVTVLSELQEAISPEKLLLLCKLQKEMTWKQRLGYLFDVIETTELSKVIEQYLSTYQRLDYIPLSSGTPTTQEQTRNNKWKIIENISIESDL